MTKKNPDLEQPATFGQHVKLLREDRGWTQEQLAGFAGVSRLTISEIERDITKEPGRKVVDGLATAFGVTRQVLEAGTMPDAQPVEPARVSDRKSSLSPLLERYFRERELLEEEKAILRALGTLRFRGQPLSFDVYDDVIASLRRTNPRPGPSGASSG